jgi:16S rRNA A1518/A1519 N6-dimethyltransferase RsmA/KsgA/DIM1 with predicted DNA glycosylase/AP lyase activity
MTRKPLPVWEAGAYPMLRAVVTRAFSYRRKKLRRVFSLMLRDLGLKGPEPEKIGESTGIDLDLRPEALSPDDFIRIARYFLNVQ